jgi:hypothetical protein
MSTIASWLEVQGTRRGLLVCGVAAALVYVATDVVAAVRWEGYRYVSQTISELMAVGAPTRGFVVGMFLVHDVLLGAFGVGVWEAGRRWGLRVTGGLLIGIAVVGGIAAPLFPMHLRGMAGSLTDSLHIVATSVIAVCTLVAVGSAATVGGRWFRIYSVGTIAVLIVFGMLAGLDGPRMAAQEPTPWLGIKERMDVYAYLLWLSVLAAVLWRTDRPRARAG